MESSIRDLTLCGDVLFSLWLQFIHYYVLESFIPVLGVDVGLRLFYYITVC